MASLIQLSDEILQLQQMLDASEHEPETIALIEDYLKSLSSGRDRKLDDYAALVRELEIRAEVRAGEARRLTALVKRDEDTVARLKENLRVVFTLHGWKTVETDRFRLTLAQNGGKQRLVVGVPPEELEERFRRVETKVVADNDALREALADGEVVEGVRLEERGSTIRIG